MSALLNVVKAASGEAIRLAKQIGKGGEGAVFEVDGKPELAVKFTGHKRQQTGGTKFPL
jgi:hypothetical protein